MTATTQSLHRLTVGSIDDPPLKAMLNGITVDLLYCDPPWDDGHMKSFARGASENREVPLIPMSWLMFMRSLVGVINHHVSGWVFVEMGTRHAEAAASLISEACVDVVTYNTVYGSPKRPSALLVGHTDHSVKGRWRMPSEATHGGYRQVGSVVASVGRPGQGLLDPCCGLGYSARAARAAGMIFFGNELDPQRAAATRRLLEK
jgi:hypothetical protein